MKVQNALGRISKLEMSKSPRAQSYTNTAESGFKVSQQYARQESYQPALCGHGDMSTKLMTGPFLRLWISAQKLTDIHLMLLMFPKMWETLSLETSSIGSCVGVVF